ncbi:MAG: hypothetical protein ACOCWQ_04035 [Nanoarchaeota archaeon]
MYSWQMQMSADAKEHTNITSGRSGTLVIPGISEGNWQIPIEINWCNYNRDSYGYYSWMIE